uniref:Uncharacterized protein n=1 Tax=Arundo donax TaxID=35708 RepID=A0A0A8ZTJ5_ARUDO
MATLLPPLCAVQAYTWAPDLASLFQLALHQRQATGLVTRTVVEPEVDAVTAQQCQILHSYQCRSPCPTYLLRRLQQEVTTTFCIQFEKREL